MSDLAFGAGGFLVAVSFIAAGMTWMFAPKEWARFNRRLGKTDMFMEQSEWRQRTVRVSGRLIGGGAFIGFGILLQFPLGGCSGERCCLQGVDPPTSRKQDRGEDRPRYFRKPDLTGVLLLLHRSLSEEGGKSGEPSKDCRVNEVSELFCNASRRQPYVHSKPMLDEN